MKKLLSVIIIFVMTISLMTVSASAFSDEPDITKDFSVGEVVLWNFAGSGYARDVSIIEGDLPAGLICTRAIGWGTPLISGVPIEEGTFEFVVRVQRGNSAKEYDIVINVGGGSPWGGVIPTEEPAELEITKEPSSETVNEGDTAYFISYCDNAKEMNWVISDPSGETEYNADEAAAHFPGLVISGADTDTLELRNIPYSIDGWRIQCVFKGAGDATAKSSSAIIHVNKPAPDAPVIVDQPKSGSYTVGESAVLSVSTAASDAEMKYQWFSSPINDVSSMSPVAGATSASFTVPQTEGTMYYSVSVTATKDGRSSEVKYSDAAAVTYTAAVPTPVITPTATASPSQADKGDGGSDINGSDASSAKSEKEESHSSFLFLLAVAFFLLAGLIVFLLVMSKRRTKIMRCPKCGFSLSEGTVQCPSCGERIIK